MWAYFWKKFSQCFLVICMIVTTILLVWCYSEYSENDDVVEVSFKKYGKDDDSIYPDISLCFDHPFIEERLKVYDNKLTKSLYTLFLTGQDFNGKWNEKVLDINYENVSLQLKDYLIGDALIFPAESATDSHKNISIKNFSTLSSPINKCFTFHLLTNIRILKVSIALKNSIFTSGIRPKSGFDVALHFPQQIIHSGQFFLRNWPIRTNMSVYSYQMDINVKDIEILRHRRKPSNQCSNSISFDNDTFKEIMESGGCVPPYMDSTLENSLPPCKTKMDLLRAAKKISEAFTGTGEYENTIPPCKEIQRIGVKVEDTDFNSSKLLSGKDMDINLDIPFIIESWFKNCKQFYDILLQ